MSMRGLRRVAVLAVLGFTCISAAHAEGGKSEPGAAADEGEVPGEVPDDADDTDEGAGDDGGDEDKAKGGDSTGDESGDADTDEGDEEPVVALKSNREFRVVARSLRLKESSAERLREVAVLYRKATKQKLVITGGDRSASRQAQLMYKKLKAGEDLIKLYARTDLAVAIVNAYKDARAAGATRKGTIIRMRNVIEQQMDEGEYISRHLNFTAADVRSRGLSPERVRALKEAVKAVEGASLVDERDGAAPCFHLGL